MVVCERNTECGTVLENGVVLEGQGGKDLIANCCAFILDKSKKTFSFLKSNKYSTNSTTF